MSVMRAHLLISRQARTKGGKWDDAPPKKNLYSGTVGEIVPSCPLVRKIREKTKKNYPNSF